MQGLSSTPLLLLLFILGTTLTINTCPNDCKSCNRGICYQCKTGYHLNGKKNICGIERYKTFDGILIILFLIIFAVSVFALGSFMIKDSKFVFGNRGGFKISKIKDFGYELDFLGLKGKKNESGQDDVETRCASVVGY